MSSKFTLGDRQPGPRVEGSVGPAEDPQSKSTVSLQDVPQEVFEDHIIPAVKALGDGALMALGGTAKHMHAHMMRGTAVPLAVMLREHISSSRAPALPNDLAVRNIALGIRPAGVSLGESMYALRRLEELFELRGHHNAWPELGHGPSRPEAWCMEQIETALQVFLNGPDVGHLSFPTGLSEAIHSLKASRMRPLLQWQAEESSGSELQNYYLDLVVEEIKQCAEKQVKALNLWHYRMSEMPPIWLYAAHIETLRIPGGPMRHLPPELGQMNRLRSLNLGDCENLRPDLFANVPAGLKELTVRSALLESVGTDVFRLTHLERFELSNCGVMSLPEKFADLRNLTHLNLTGAHLDAALCDQLHSLEGIKSLNLSRCGVSRFGDRPLFPKNLEILTLAHCELTEVPQSVSRLYHLRELSLPFNGIHRIDGSFDDLKELEYLFLAYNKLSVFTVGDDSLRGLVHLDLAANDFRDVPMGVFSLVALKNLYISHNDILSVPNSWEKLSELEELSVGRDTVLDLGSSIDKCRKLREVRNGKMWINFDPTDERKINAQVEAFRREHE